MSSSAIAARERAARKMTARRARTTLYPAASEPRFVVLCARYDGREREWQRYSTRAEAERVAQHLTSIGCRSRVADELWPVPKQCPATT
jgi:glutamine synthetase